MYVFAVRLLRTIEEQNDEQPKPTVQTRPSVPTLGTPNDPNSSFRAINSNIEAFQCLFRTTDNFLMHPDFYKIKGSEFNDK